MTVVFFCRFFYPHIGGVEKHVFEVSKRLLKKGHTVIVITEQHDRNLHLRETYQGIKIYRIPVGIDQRQKKYVIWNWLFRQRKLIKKAEVIHCHDVFFWYIPFRILFPLKKVYTTFHGYEGNVLPTNRSRFMHKVAETFSKGNICVGDYLAKWYGTKPGFVTYGAVSVPKDLQENAGRHHTKEIVFVGRLDPEAGILRYLEVLNKVKEKGYIPHLTVLGEGILLALAKQYVKKHRLNVSFFGAVSDISPFLERADFVFTARYLSTLESFAHKRYVFCLYNNPIHKDYFVLAPFRHWICLSNDISILAQRVRALIENPSLHNGEIQRAHIWVRKQTWETLISTYLKLWLR